MKNARQQVLKCLNYFGPQDLQTLTTNLKKRNADLGMAITQQTLEELVECKKVRHNSGTFISNVRVGGEEE